MDFSLSGFLNWFITIAIVVGATAFAAWLISKSFANQANNRLYRQLAYTGLVHLAILVLILVMPFAEGTNTRQNLIQLFGLVFTAVIGLSSTTFVSNAMAGLMLKATGAFNTGDFVHVAEHFGRVTGKSLLHTEIQDEDRDIIILPNMLLITNPVEVVDQSGTLIAADVSIGFDVHRRRVKEPLLQAIEKAELTDGFVHIKEIGDYAVRYRATGFLSDIGQLVSKRSELRAQMLDALHAAQIEVMTPSVMNQRPIAPETAFIPQRELTPEPAADSGKAEQIMFQKAELATRIEKLREQSTLLEKEIKQLKEQSQSDDPQSEHVQREITWREHQLASLQSIVQDFEHNNG